MKLFGSHKKTLDELIAGCKQNERRSQEEMYKRHFQMALRIVRRYTQDEETQLHIINEAFLRIFTRIGQYEGTGSFKGWMSKLIFHEVSNHFRKKQSHFKFIELDDVMNSPVRNEADLKIESADLEDAIKSLPESSRQVFVLFAIEGYSHKEIAKKLNIQEGTSKWHVNNARTLLKGQLQKSEAYKHRRYE